MVVHMKINKKESNIMTHIAKHQLQELVMILKENCRQGENYLHQ